MLESVLVANRGEIAVRIMRTCRALGIRTVAVVSEADLDAEHRSAADEHVVIGPAPAARSYLDIDAVVAAAVRTGVDAVHPGYGFLSENAGLPEALAEAGVGWIGPSPGVIRLLGDKAAAKAELGRAGVPVLPGTTDPDLDDEAVTTACGELGFPLLLKAVAGGGGKGMRVVRGAGEVAEALAAVRREATAAFGDGRVLVEKLVEHARHVEVQVLGDTHGTVLHLHERECSLQRRHQKVVEEAPAARLDPAVRARLHDAAVTAAETVGYVNAGTVEFLVDGAEVWFLEINTRLQVEHPVTELVTGLDLVELQLRVAAGEPLPVAQDEVTVDGHAVEARVYAEDPHVGFLPQTGRFDGYGWAEVDGRSPAATVRVDAGRGPVTPHYDPMLAKVIAHGSDREQALDRLHRAVTGMQVRGVRTNLEWLGDLLAAEPVRAGEATTDWLDGWTWSEPPLSPAALAAAGRAVGTPTAATTPHAAAPAVGAAWGRPLRTGGGGHVLRLQERDDVHRVEVAWRAGRLLVERTLDLAAGTTERLDDAAPPADAWRHGDTVWVHHRGRMRPLTVVPATRHRDLDAIAGATALTSPMPGSVVAIEVSQGEQVTEGATLVVVEAMKMEHPVTAPSAGTVRDLAVAVGDGVAAGQALVTIEPEADGSE